MRLLLLTYSLALLMLLGASAAQAQQSCAVPAATPGGAAGATQRPSPNTLPNLPCASQTVIRVNVHYVLRSNGTGNFTETSDRGSQDVNGTYGQTWPNPNAVPEDTLTNGYAFAKGIIWGAIGQSQSNPQLWLPVGNAIPRLPKRLSYVLNGVYFHRNDALYNYDPIDIGTSPAGTLAQDQFNALGLNKSTEVNIFIMAQNTRLPNPVPNNPTYRYLTGGASSYGFNANNLWMKLGNLWRIHLLVRSENNGVDATTTWLAAGALNHEVGHLLKLSHAFDPNECADTPNGGGVSGNNVMDYGTNQVALTPCQIDRIQTELNANYRGYTTCGCGPVNSFFTLPETLTVIGANDWVWLDARGSFVDNTTTASYELTEVNQSNQPNTPIFINTVIAGEPTRYKLHLRANTRYRVTLTVRNSCNSSSSTKYIDTRYTSVQRGAVAPGQYAVFPNPTTEQFTVRTDAPLPAAPLVRDAHGRTVPLDQLAERREAGVWYTTFCLRQSRPGLYVVEMGSGAARTIAHLAIQ